jgi:hypothetical protein
MPELKHLSRDPEDATDERSDLRRNEARRRSQMQDAADPRVPELGRTQRRIEGKKNSIGCDGERVSGGYNQQQTREDNTYPGGQLFYFCRDDTSRARVC